MRCLDLDTNAECEFVAGAAVALGNFDGVHIGHRRIFDALGDDLPKAAFTFSDLRQSDLLCAPSERLSLIRSCGVRRALVADFAEVRDMTPAAFCDLLCGAFGAKRLVCGFNFTFGAGGKGSPDDLRRLAAEREAEAVVVDPVMLDGAPVSSTRVRTMLRAGDIPGVEAALGRKCAYTLTVIHGRELGRKMGYPTINQAFPECLAAPRFGVYASRCVIDGQTLFGVTNVGVRPTVDGEGRAVSLETHIFDYSRELYKKPARVELCSFLRDERRFSSTVELFEQVAKDAARAREYFDVG